MEEKKKEREREELVDPTVQIQSFSLTFFTLHKSLSKSLIQILPRLFLNRGFLEDLWTER